MNPPTIISLVSATVAVIVAICGGMLYLRKESVDSGRREAKLDQLMVHLTHLSGKLDGLVETVHKHDTELVRLGDDLRRRRGICPAAMNGEEHD